MDNYRFTITKRNKKPKKILVAAVSVAVFLLAVVMFVGIIAGTDSTKNQNISSAIAENTQLKQLVGEQEAKIAALSAEVEELRAMLASVPQPEPTPYQPQEGEAPSQQMQPEYPETPRDELR